MPLDFQVVVDIDFGELPDGELVALLGQGSEGGAIDLREELPTVPGELAEGALVEPLEELADGSKPSESAEAQPAQVVRHLRHRVRLTLVLGDLGLQVAGTEPIHGKGKAGERRVEGKGLIHHSDRGSQQTSIAFTERLIEAGMDASVGSVGDALDNALAESTIGLFKTELTKGRSWRTFEQVEWESAKWVDWYNRERLHSAIDYRSPAAFEEAFYQSQGSSAEFAWEGSSGPSIRDEMRSIHDNSVTK